MTPRTYGLRCGSLAMAALLGAGCAKDTVSYRAVPNINIAQPTQLDSQGALVLQTEPAGPKAKVSDAVARWLRDTQSTLASPRTVLVVAIHHDHFFYNLTEGRTLVIFLDPHPKPGQVWLNPDNAVLLSYSAYSAPIRERVNLAGSVDIKSVKGNQIVAALSVRDTTSFDSTAFLDKPFDPLARTYPFRLWGEHTFIVTSQNDPLFEKSAIKWVSTGAPSI